VGVGGVEAARPGRRDGCVLLVGASFSSKSINHEGSTSIVVSGRTCDRLGGRWALFAGSRVDFRGGMRHRAYHDGSTGCGGPCHARSGDCFLPRFAGATASWYR